MTSHPDADAFMRVYLRKPNDHTTRLVFADWLEETGEPSNRAWAYFIRAKAEADRHPLHSAQRREQDAEAKRFAPHILANLTIPAAVFAAHTDSLLQLLPAPNITVRLVGFDFPENAINLIPESVAREVRVLVFAIHNRVLLVAAEDPRDQRMLETLEFILNRQVIAVRAEPDDIEAAIELIYADASVDFDLVHPIEVLINPAYQAGGPQSVVEGVELDAPVNQLVGLILNEARQLGANRVQVSPIGGVGLRYRVDGEWSRRERLPDRVLLPIAARLARMAHAEDQFRNTGGARGTIPCTAGGSRFAIRLAIEPLDEGPAIQLDLIQDQASAEF